MTRGRIVAVVMVVVLAGCTTHEHASPLPSASVTEGAATASVQPNATSASPTPACGTAALPVDSPNFCEAPPGITGPLQCTATMLQQHPGLSQSAVVEITTDMWAAIRVIATSATFVAAQDSEADAQGRATDSIDISSAEVGVPVDVKVEVFLQDAPEAYCATTFTPIAAAAGASSP